MQPASGVCPEQFPIMLTCITRSSSFIEWWYNNHKGYVSLVRTELGETKTNDLFNATLTNITVTSNGETIILSNVYLNGLLQDHNEITVTCRNGDFHELTNITFSKSGKETTSYILLL